MLSVLVLILYANVFIGIEVADFSYGLFGC
jgi:hypothetical protein